MVSKSNDPPPCTCRVQGPSGAEAVARTTCELRCHVPRLHSFAIYRQHVRVSSGVKRLRTCTVYHTSATNMLRRPVFGSVITLAPQLVQLTFVPEEPPKK